MEKRKIIGLSLLGASAPALGLGIYTTVSALTLNHNTEAAKSKESASVSNVIKNVYGSTEQKAKDMGLAAGLLAGAAVAGGLILLTAGGLLLSPIGIRMQKMKYLKIAAIAAGVVAIGSPILGAISVGLYHTPTVQQAKQFIDFSKKFEEVFMGNVNAVETKARDMLEKANWMDFAGLLTDIQKSSPNVKMEESFRTSDPENYFKQHYAMAANMYVLGGKGTLEMFKGMGFTALDSSEYYKGFDWGNTDYGRKLSEVMSIRDNFIPGDVKSNGDILDNLESYAVVAAAKKSAEWFKNTMHQYHADFGDKATDEVITLTLAKLAYVSGNKNISTSHGENNSGGNLNIHEVPDTSDHIVSKMLIPSSLSHFKSVNGLTEENGFFKLKDDFSKVIGIEELVNQYKPNWLSDPLKYIFTEPGTNRTMLDENYLNSASINTIINKEWLGTYFKSGEKLYIDNSVLMTDFNQVKTGLAGVLMPLIPTASTLKTYQIFQAAANTFKGQTLTQMKDSYFIQLKLPLAKNYVQQVMNEISDTLTNHADDIYK